MGRILDWANSEPESNNAPLSLILCGGALLLGLSFTPTPIKEAAGVAVDAIANGQNPISAIANSGDNFDRVIKLIERVEGGWSNHPSDRGGATKYGITAATASRHGLNVANITREQAREIYRKDYWIPSGASAAPWPLNLAIMNSYVNSGKKWQIIGKTPLEQAINYINQQNNYYHQIIAAKPSQSVFANGWFRRTKFMAEAARGGNPNW